jgi:sugar phosphate isomerase/epimerase
MYPAIFSRTYPARDIAAVLAAIRADGFEGAQMNLSSFGMESLPRTLDEAALARGRAGACWLGVTLSALSGTYNMAHPDPAERHARRPGFVQVLRAAQVLGAPVVTLCTGSRDPADMWRAHPDNATPQAWSDLRTELDWALAQAADRGLALAIEPEPGNVVCDAPAARRLLDETAAPNLGIILDAANLIGTEGLARQGEITRRAVDLLGGDILLAHAKDIDRGGRVVAPGDGAIDLVGFVAALASAGFGGALIAHGFEARDGARAGKAMAALCGAVR